MRFFVNDKTCSGCGSCGDVCPTDAIKMIDNRAVITVECIACGSCPRVCPEGAIKQAQLASVFNSNTESFQGGSHG